jgi:hypothetical protein
MYLERLSSGRNLVASRVAELHLVQRTREAVEGRYLAGHAALFPDALKAWEEQLTRAPLLGLRPMLTARSVARGTRAVRCRSGAARVRG